MSAKWTILTAATLVSQVAFADYGCEPCCVPKEKKCIDCECYVPSYYDLQCDWGVFIDAEFLYWYGAQRNLPYATKNVVNSGVSSGATQIENSYLDAKWDPGVRVGIGFNTDCDGWDAFLVWTYYKNTQSQTKTVPDFTLASLTNGSLYLSSPIAFLVVELAEIKGKWEFTYDNIDFQLGKKMWLSRYFTLRPFAAIRGMWTDTHFETKGTPLPFSPTSTGALTLDDKLKFSAWGVGMVGGLQPSWYFTPCFAIYGGFDGALLWGKRASKYFVNEFNGITALNYSTNNDSFFSMHAGLDAELGLHWEDTYCCDRYRFSIDAGWEHHMLFAHNNEIFYSDDVTFGGFVLRARFDF